MTGFKKWFVILLAILFSIAGLESCSKYAKERKKHKRILKHRRQTNIKRYHSPHQRQLKKHVIPINKNYIIRNKRKNTSRRPRGKIYF